MRKMKLPTKVPRETVLTRMTTGMGNAGKKMGPNVPKLKTKLYGR
jgi:hypothetical protein